MAIRPHENDNKQIKPTSSIPSKSANDILGDQKPVHVPAMVEITLSDQSICFLDVICGEQATCHSLRDSINCFPISQRAQWRHLCDRICT